MSASLGGRNLLADSTQADIDITQILELNLLILWTVMTPVTGMLFSEISTQTSADLEDMFVFEQIVCDSLFGLELDMSDGT